MTRSPKSYIISVTAAIVCIQVIVFAYFLIQKRVDAKRTETQALEMLRAIQSGTVKEVFFYDYNLVQTTDELTPAKISAWEKRIDELQWLGDDAFERIPYPRDQVGSLNVEITPNRIIRIDLYDHREESYDELPTSEKFKGIYIAYTPNRGFVMR